MLSFMSEKKRNPKWDDKIQTTILLNHVDLKNQNSSRMEGQLINNNTSRSILVLHIYFHSDKTT